jgi:catechol 2,3-dioxygenase
MSTVRGHPDSRLPAATRPGAVTLAVADAASQEAFYRDVLGLEVLVRDTEVIELGTGTGPLVRLLPGAQGQRGPGSPGLYHLAVLLPDRAALGAWLAHAFALGTPLQGAADHEVSEAIYLADPEGNGVEVYRDRPRHAWRVAAGRVHMVTEPLDARALVDAATGPWAGAPAATTIGHIHLQVSDLDRSRTFYADALGLRVTSDAFRGACFLAAGDYHHHLGLNTWAVRPGPAGQAAGAGLVEFELVLSTAHDVARTVARLKGAGVAVRTEGPAPLVADPDGIGLRLRSAGEGR